MGKGIRLVKTCVGNVSEYTIMCLADRATDIAMETNITYEEALTVLLKLSSKAIDGWYNDGYELYLDFNYYYDYFVVNEDFNATEIACCSNDNESYIYNVEKKKFYKKYTANDYGDERIKEEIAI